MWKWREPAKPAEPDEGGEVSDECEALLAGRWAEYRRARGDDVPPWAWLNRVAHADERALRYAAAAPAWSRHDMDDWARLRSCVAESLVLRAGEKGMPIGDLQRMVLVPLELRLFSDEAMQRMGTAELLIWVLSALRHPSAQSGSR